MTEHLCNTYVDFINESCLNSNHKCALNILYINARSIKNKFDELQLMIKLEVKPDIVCITETWLYSNEEKFFTIPEYNVVFNTRDTSRGGGVAIYLKSNLKYRKGKVVNNVHQITEVVVQIENKSVSVICVYNPNNVNAHNMHDDMEIIFANDKGNMIIVGDFNINLLSDDSTTQSHTDLVQSYGLEFCNLLVPTRITDHSSTIIDHVITTPNLVNKLLLVDHYLSDHRIVLIKTTLPVVTNQLFTKCLTKVNLNKFLKYCQKKKLVDEANDVVEYYAAFKSYIQEGIDNSLDSKLIEPRKFVSSPWINEDYLYLCQLKNQWFKKTKESRPHKWTIERYKFLCNQVTAMKRDLKQKYYANEFAKAVTKPNEVWKILNKLTKGVKDVNNCNEIKISGVVTKDTNVIVDAINEYYANIPLDLTNKITPCDASEVDMIQSYNRPQANCSMRIVPATAEEILNIVSKLKDSHTRVNGCISASMLKHCINELVPYILRIVNLSLRDGLVPDDLKISKVTPIFKSGDKQDMGNYRPISVQSPISKIIEKCIKVRVTKFLTET